MTRTTRDLSDRHEAFLAEVFDGRVTPGSGNGFANQADVRNDARRQYYAFAVDGKATAGKGITITRDMLDKIEEQAHNEMPAIALRWYADERLRRSRDWIAVEAGVFEDLLADARAYRASKTGPMSG